MKARYKKIILKIVKVIIPLSITLAVLFFVVLAIKAFFKETGYFNIKEIIIIGNGKLDLAKDSDLNNLIGANIFEVDLEGVASGVMLRYPGILKTEVMRNLPNRLTIKIMMRKPIAQIKLNKYFLIDRDAVLLPEPLGPPREDLIIISGLENRASGVVGRRLSLKEITITLNLIETIKKTRDLKDYQVTEINAWRLTDISISLRARLNTVRDTKSQNLIQVKIGSEDFENRLKILLRLLTSIKTDLDKVKYIDLRFKEPVVGQE